MGGHAPHFHILKNAKNKAAAVAAINAAMAGKVAAAAASAAAAGDTATAAKMRRFLSPPPPGQRGSAASAKGHLQHPQGRRYSTSNKGPRPSLLDLSGVLSLN